MPLSSQENRTKENPGVRLRTLLGETGLPRGPSQLSTLLLGGNLMEGSLPYDLFERTGDAVEAASRKTGAHSRDSYKNGGAPKERRRRRAEKRLSKRVFLESPFLLCSLKVFRTFQAF